MISTSLSALGIVPYELLSPAILFLLMNSNLIAEVKPSKNAPLGDFWRPGCLSSELAHDNLIARHTKPAVMLIKNRR